MLWELLKKEIRLQKSNLYFVLAIILVWGILLALATRAEVEIGGRHDVTIGVVVSLLQIGFVGFCLLVIAPLLVGAAMVAEERKLGVWEWQLSLPCPRRVQWAVKLLVGCALTLALTLIVQPLLDFLLLRVMGSHATDVALPSVLLGMNEIYRTLPLLLMMSAAFVSSMSKDPYKAFFVGILFFGFVAACFTAFDPSHLLVLPWNLKADRDSTRLLLDRHIPWMLGLGLCAGLALIAWFNFRLEGFRWRRVLAEFAAVAVLCVVATWGGLHLEFGIGDQVSQEAADVEPFIQYNREKVPDAEKIVDWTGIEPILVRRFKPADEKHTLERLEYMEMFSRGSGFVSRVIRIPGTGNVLTQTPTLPVLEFPGKEWTQEFRERRMPQAIEASIDKPQLRPVFCLIGEWLLFSPADSGYEIRTGQYRVFQPQWCPLPIKANGLLGKIFVRRPLPLTPDEQFLMEHPDRKLRIGGKIIQFEYAWPLNTDKGFFVLGLPGTNSRAPREHWLIRKNPDDSWTVIQKQMTYGSSDYRVSLDGKWFTPDFMDGFQRAKDSRALSLGVYACDHTASWTLQSDGDLLALAGHMDWFAQQGMGTGLSLLRVSPSGRFMPFMRTSGEPEVYQRESFFSPKNIQFVRYSHLEIALLDLQTGRENILIETEKMGRPQYFPPMVWAPDRDALAILFDENIHVFEKRAVTEADFQSLGAVDLTGFEIRDVDFWDPDVLLAWGGTGLYRINLAKALNPTP